MWRFLTDLVRRSGVTRTVILVDDEEVGKTRRYQIQPRRMLAAWGGSLVVAGLLAGVLLSFSPLRNVVPGGNSEEMRENARLNAMRLQALQDSLIAQRHYIERLQKLITGKVGPAAKSDPASQNESPPADVQPRQGKNLEEGTTFSSRSGHAQPAIPLSNPLGPEITAMERENLSSRLSFPVKPPVENGFPTREFGPQTDHYGIDLAVSEGAFVRAIGDGYVVFADWTRDGGYAIAIQHSGGYLSVYKHNKRLLKHLGDRVRAREPLAVSGNTGEITTGPHLHFELWQNGLAQDPRSYIAGW